MENTLEQKKEEMKYFTDLFGGGLNHQDIENATTEEQLSEIFDKHYELLSDMANDAQRALERFKKKIGVKSE